MLCCKATLLDFKWHMADKARWLDSVSWVPVVPGQQIRAIIIDLGYTRTVPAPRVILAEQRLHPMATLELEASLAVAVINILPTLARCCLAACRVMARGHVTWCCRWRGLGPRSHVLMCVTRGRLASQSTARE